MTVDMNNVYEMMYRGIQSRAQFSIDQFKQAMRDWIVIPVLDQRGIVGGVMMRENELHISTGRRFYGDRNQIIRDILEPVVARYKLAKTTVSKDNPRGLKFCQRLGFKVVSEDDNKWHLQCDRCEYYV